MNMPGKSETEADDLRRWVDNPTFAVVGCGGGGCNSVDRLMRIGVHGARTVALNTDAKHLQRIRADAALLIGGNRTRGWGAGGRPEVGESAAEESREEIAAIMKGADMVFVTAGMGGGTGTGSAPIVAEVARDMGAVVVSIVTTPFDSERGRADNARAGLDKLRRVSDSTIVLDNNRLLKLVPKLPFDDALSVMDQLISEVIKSVTEAITKDSLINIDFADLRSIVKAGHTSTIVYAEDSAHDPERLVVDAMNNPFLEVDYSGASGALIHVTVGPKAPLATVNQVLAGVTTKMDMSANVIMGARLDEECQNSIKLMGIITGVKSQNLLGPRAEVCEAQAVRLGARDILVR
jgi:cell division protein FtsZ